MRTTRKQLPPALRAQLFTDLSIVLTDTRNNQQMCDFLVRFLSPNELLVLSKRIGILKRLYSDYSYEEIQSELQVSSATISSIAAIKDHASTDRAIDKLAVHQWAEKVATFIRRLFP